MRRKDRGVVLANVLMMMIVILLVVAAMMQLSFGRAVSVRRHRASVDAHQINQSALNIMAACLATQNWPPSTSCSGTLANGGGTVTGWSSCGATCQQATLTLTPSAGLSYSVTVKWYSTGQFEAVCNDCI